MFVLVKLILAIANFKWSFPFPCLRWVDHKGLGIWVMFWMLNADHFKTGDHLCRRTKWVESQFKDVTNMTVSGSQGKPFLGHWVPNNYLRHFHMPSSMTSITDESITWSHNDRSGLRETFIHPVLYAQFTINSSVKEKITSRNIPPILLKTLEQGVPKCILTSDSECAQRMDQI